MTDSNAENRRLAGLLKLLLEAETGEDSMICHDGGFRYSGDFMSIEPEVVEPTSMVDSDDLQRLRERGLITGTRESGGIRVTDAGRWLAYAGSD